MNLTFRYFKIGIEGMRPEKFESILLNDDAIKVKMANNGMVMLDNNKIIKCVKYYYSPIGKAIATKKAANQCFYTQQSLGVNCGTNQCRSCHLICLDLKKAGRIIYR